MAGSVALRALIPPLLVIVLLALLLTMFSGFVKVSSELAASKRREVLGCRLGPLLVWLHASYREGNVVIDYSIQAPNPCYKVKSVRLVSFREDTGIVYAVLWVDATGPGPGKVCVQVLPPPVTGAIPIHVSAKPQRVELLLTLQLRLDNGATQGDSCRAELGVG